MSKKRVDQGEAAAFVTSSRTKNAYFPAARLNDGVHWVVVRQVSQPARMHHRVITEVFADAHPELRMVRVGRLRNLSDLTEAAPVAERHVEGSRDACGQ